MKPTVYFEEGKRDSVGGAFVPIVKYVTFAESKRISCRKLKQVRRGFFVVPFVERPR